jgi:hypothetical protein
MKRNYFTCLLVFLLVCSLPILCFAEYKVVIKKNGKIIEGRLLTETDTSVTIVSAGAHISFKKADLDLDKMKELNANYSKASDAKTIQMTNETPDSADATVQQAQPSQLNDLAKQGTNTKETGKTPGPADSNEKAFMNYIGDMEKQIKQGDITDEKQTEILGTLGTAKKGLSNYRARNTRTLTKSEQTLMLEELINSLEFELDQELKKEAPDATIAALKKNIDAKKEELSKLQ